MSKPGSGGDKNEGAEIISAGHVLTTNSVTPTASTPAAAVGNVMVSSSNFFINYN